MFSGFSWGGALTIGVGIVIGVLIAGFAAKIA